MKARRGPATASTRLETLVGTLQVVASPRGLRRVEFAETPSGAPGRTRDAQEDDVPSEARRQLAVAVRQLREYFAGTRSRFRLTLDLEGTPHQLRVWRALAEIPFGETVTYGEIARRLGSPAGARAGVKPGRLRLSGGGDRWSP